MKRFVTATALAGALLGAATPTAAQDYRYAAGWNGGGAWFSAMNQGAGGGPQDIQLDPGWITGVQFEQWHGAGRIGTRLNGAITQRPLSAPGQNADVTAWMADADVMVRLMPATEHTVVNPYVGVGIGLVRYKLGTGDFIHLPDAGATYPGRSPALAAGVGFAGFDVLTRLRWDHQPVGFRIEAANHVMHRSPFEPAGGGDFNPVHNVRVVIGVFSGFGRLRD